MSDFYAVGEKERLSAESIEEAVDEYLEEIHPDQPPETVMVQGFNTMKIRQISGLDEILERLDDEYADPDGGGTEITDVIRAAWTEFEKVLRAEYRVWMCDHDGAAVEVNVATKLPTGGQS